MPNRCLIQNLNFLVDSLLGFVAAVCVPCGHPFSLWTPCWLFSSRTSFVVLGFAAAVCVRVDTLSLSGLPAGCSLRGHPLWFWALPLLSVFRVDTFSLSGLPAGCSLRGHPSWIWTLRLLAVFRVDPLFSLDSLLVVLFGDILCDSGLYRCCLCSVIENKGLKTLNPFFCFGVLYLVPCQ